MLTTRFGTTGVRFLIHSMKICSRCGKSKELNNREFLPDSRYTDGYHSHCRACRCEIARWSYVRRLYGITKEEYNNLISSIGKCQACGQSNVKLVLDHDHLTGSIRGVLCSKCNTALGLLMDDLTKIEALGNYLRASLSYS
jgi:Recombination endonuclease VII